MGEQCPECRMIGGHHVTCSKHPEDISSMVCETDMQVKGEWLVCCLPMGHDGFHYDQQADISYWWGKPDV